VSRFQASDSFSHTAQDLELLPLRFERLPDEQFIVSNLVGDMLLLDGDELRRLATLELDSDDDLYARAFEKLLVRRRGQRFPLQLLALRLRSRMAFLRAPTQLHILVVTLRCEHSCPYCQVSRRSADRDRYDMSTDTAVRAIDVALSSPSAHIKIEFQGGEPLLNFELIRDLVPLAKERAKAAGKEVEFVITSNLALLTDDILDFCKQHAVLLSTSLDGPADLHNHNRPRPGGNSHELAVDGIRRAQMALGRERVGALMTTTQASMDRVEEIVDEYVRRDLDGIFLRPLSPYGFAVKTKQFFKYDSRAWLDFYERGLRYILKLNRQGHYFPEFYTALLMRRMLTDQPTGFVDLRSPAGTGLGALIYNYDGKVFAADEGRMLAEMGDRTFELGDLATDTYSSIILSDKLIDMVSKSLTQCAPQCNTCAFEPHCGADPVYHHATQQDPVGIKPLSEFCARQKGVMTLLVRLLSESPEDAAILRRWAARSR
jgi:His-Xaa-Ser system radical SAM maturase HxsB